MINTNQGRFYDVNGLSLPSVTTILGMLQKPALIPWAAKITAEACQDYIYTHGQHDVISGTVSLTAEDVDDMVTVSKKAHRTKKREAADIGTAIHEAIALWIDTGGRYMPDDPADCRYIGLQSFLSFGEEHDLQIINSEQVVSDGKTYAGRYDLLCRLDGSLTLLDIKTSSGIYPEMWFQLHAYAACIKPRPKHLAVFLIDKVTGSYRTEFKPFDTSIIKGFRLLARAYPIIKGVK